MRIEDNRSLSVSVIIPTRNAGSSFRNVLEYLWEQTVVPKEIIVMDSSSTDGTAELAASLGATVHVIDQAEYDHGGTRNQAAAYASGGILVFMTQDAMPNHVCMIENLIRPLIDTPVIACAYARQLAAPGAGLLEQMSRSYNYPKYPSIKSREDLPSLGLKTFFCSNVCSAIRKDIFNELGCFPEPVIFNEDMFFAAKCVNAGYKIAYASQAEVIHSHDYSFMQQFKRYFDNGVSISMDKWIQSHAAVGREGSRLVKLQLKEIARRRRWSLLHRLIMEAGAKYIGFQLGLRHRMLPDALCEKLSMHRKIWAKLKTIQEKNLSVNG